MSERAAPVKFGEEMLYVSRDFPMREAFLKEYPHISSGAVRVIELFVFRKVAAANAMAITAEDYVGEDREVYFKNDKAIRWMLSKEFDEEFGWRPNLMNFDKPPAELEEVYVEWTSRDLGDYPPEGWVNES